jgi:hypothetical protein
MRNKIGGQSGNVKIENILKSKITGHCTTTNKKWRDSRRDLSKFLNKSNNCLQLEFISSTVLIQFVTRLLHFERCAHISLFMVLLIA